MIIVNLKDGKTKTLVNRVGERDKLSIKAIVNDSYLSDLVQQGHVSLISTRHLEIKVGCKTWNFKLENSISQLLVVKEGSAIVNQLLELLNGWVNGITSMSSMTPVGIKPQFEDSRREISAFGREYLYYVPQARLLDEAELLTSIRDCVSWFKSCLKMALCDLNYITSGTTRHSRMIVKKGKVLAWMQTRLWVQACTIYGKLTLGEDDYPTLTGLTKSPGLEEAILSMSELNKSLWFVLGYGHKVNNKKVVGFYSNNSWTKLAEWVHSNKDEKWYAVKFVTIPKSDGGARPLGVPSHISKLVQRLFAPLLMKETSEAFKKARKKGIFSIVDQKGTTVSIPKGLSESITKSKCTWFVNSDISNAFCELDRKAFAEVNLAGPVKRCVESFYDSYYVVKEGCAGTRSESDGTVSFLKSVAKDGSETWINLSKDTGMAQGMVLSPMWFDYSFLTSVINKFKARFRNIRIWMYRDDVVIGCDSEKRAIKLKEAWSRFCLKVGLRVNVTKTKVAQNYESLSVSWFANSDRKVDSNIEFEHYEPCDFNQYGREFHLVKAVKTVSHKHLGLVPTRFIDKPMEWVEKTGDKAGEHKWVLRKWLSAKACKRAYIDKMSNREEFDVDSLIELYGYDNGLREATVNTAYLACCFQHGIDAVEFGRSVFWSSKEQTSRSWFAESDFSILNRDNDVAISLGDLNVIQDYLGTSSWTHRNRMFVEGRYAGIRSKDGSGSTKVVNIKRLGECDLDNPYTLYGFFEPKEVFGIDVLVRLGIAAWYMGAEVDLSVIARIISELDDLKTRKLSNSHIVKELRSIAKVSLDHLSTLSSEMKLTNQSKSNIASLLSGHYVTIDDGKYALGWIMSKLSYDFEVLGLKIPTNLRLFGRPERNLVDYGVRKRWNDEIKKAKAKLIESKT